MNQRQQTIELLCNKIVDPDTPEDIKLSTRRTLNELTSNKISAEEAFLRLSDSVKYWKSIDLPKSLFDNIKKYKKGTLTSIQRSKLVSSIVTRCLIEIEFHPDIDPSVTGIYEFLDYLNYILGKDNSKLYSEDYLSELLDKYGFTVGNEEVI